MYKQISVFYIMINNVTLKFISVCGQRYSVFETQLGVSHVRTPTIDPFMKMNAKCPV